MDKKIIQKAGKYFTETEKHLIIRELISRACTAPSTSDAPHSMIKKQIKSRIIINPSSVQNDGRVVTNQFSPITMN